LVDGLSKEQRDATNQTPHASVNRKRHDAAITWRAVTIVADKRTILFSDRGWHDAVNAMPQRTIVHTNRCKARPLRMIACTPRNRRSRQCDSRSILPKIAIEHGLAAFKRSCVVPRFGARHSMLHRNTIP
jgi:hypothetical protein